MSVDPKALGSRIREAREELGWSQVELAERAGISKSTVPRYERGEVVDISLDIVHSLAKALNVHIDWLCDGTGEKDLS
jgi:transcriptional regulator with XRE-family HTH domain